MAEIIYNGKSSKDFNLRIYNDLSHELSAYDVETEPVPGRDGVLLMDNKRLKPVERAFPMKLSSDVYASTTAISEWLGAKGWHDLELSWDSDYLYRATVINTISIEETLKQLGRLQVVFLMHPIKYFKDSLDSEAVSNGEVVLNRGNVNAQPFIELTGYGDAVITINDRRTVLENLQGSIVLDMERKLVYRDSTSHSSEWDKVMREEGAEFPYLEPGENVVSWTGDMTMTMAKNEGVRL